MSTQPEALRLAADLDANRWVLATEEWRIYAAAELRRLHKEVEWMKHNMSNVSRVEQSLIAANERLHAVNTNLLEALDTLSRYADTCELFLKETHPGKAAALRDRVTNARAAIAKATGEQA